MNYRAFAAAAVWFAALAGFTAAVSAQSTFRTSGTQVIDANNNIFVMRGINHPVVWHYNQSWNTIPALRAAGYNTVRVVWENVSYRTVAELDAMLQRIIDHEMIPMLDYHGVTGSNTVSDLTSTTVNYWLRDDIRALVNKYRRYLMINIANEWGGNQLSDTVWRDAYMNALTTLRSYSEYRDMLMVIDASGWGQNPSPIKSHGQAVLNHDAARRAAHGGPNQPNIVFSIHMYGMWGSGQSGKLHVTNELTALKNTYGFPIVIGEFGYNHNNGNNNLNCTVNHLEIMQACHNLGYGWLAWSTDGNDSANAWLNMMNNWSTWNWWGQQVRDSTHGSLATSIKCSVFGGPGYGPGNGSGGNGAGTLVYGDALANDWSNWSWDSTVNLANTSPVHTGTHSAAVTSNTGWSCFSLRKGTAVSTASFDRITFRVHGGSGANKSFRFYTGSADSGSTTPFVTFTATAGQWTTVTVLLSQLGNPASIKRLYFQNASNTAQSAVYFDEIRLGPQAGNGPAPVAIYTDALASDWANWSWDTAVNLANTSPVQSGSHSVAATANAGWSALSFRKGTALATAGYSRVSFWVHGGSGANKAMRFYTSTGDGSGNSSTVNFTATAGQWNQITVSLSALGNPASIKRLYFQNASGSAQGTIYIDNVRLE